MTRSSRTRDAVDGVLDAIVDGRLTPGASLPPEADLAADLDVSRLTLREAVRILQAQGVIVPVPGSRHRIAPVEEWDGLEAVVRHARATDRPRSSVELLEMRMMIETGAAELAATRHDDDDERLLVAHLDAMVRAHADGDVDAFVDADLEFHGVLLRAADNRILLATMRPLTALLSETRRETSAVPDIREHAIREHHGVLAALRTRDAETARAAMASHMRQTREDLRELVHASPR